MLLCTLLGSFEAFSLVAVPRTSQPRLSVRVSDNIKAYGPEVGVSQWEQRYGRKAPQPYGVGEDVAPSMGAPAGGRWYGREPLLNYGVGENNPAMGLAPQLTAEEAAKQAWLAK